MPATATVNAPQTAAFLEELRAIRRRAEALLARVQDDAAFSWQPHDGRAWSVGQCLDHLNQTNRLYLSAIRDGLAGQPRAVAPVTAPVRSTWFGRWFAARMEPGTRRMPAPRKVIPRSAQRRADVSAEFFRTLDEIQAVLEDAATIDLNRAAFPSPLFTLSRVRAGTGFRILLAHLRRHLAQAEKVVTQHARSR